MYVERPKECLLTSLMIHPKLFSLAHLISAICTHVRTHAHHFRCFLFKKLVFLRARSTIVKCRGPDNCSLQSCFVGDNRQKESERENLHGDALQMRPFSWRPVLPTMYLMKSPCECTGFAQLPGNFKQSMHRNCPTSRTFWANPCIVEGSDAM